jgi:hypothetical protein
LHPGYEKNALEGLRLSLEVANDRRIKIIVNGGALNPKGLATIVAEMVRSFLSQLLFGHWKMQVSVVSV